MPELPVVPDQAGDLFRVSINSDDANSIVATPDAPQEPSVILGDENGNPFTIEVNSADNNALQTIPVPGVLPTGPSPLILPDQLGNPFAVSVNSAQNNALNATAAPGLSLSARDESVSVNVLDLISSALRLLGVLAAGEFLAAEDANNSLTVLNEMLDAWNAERQAVFSILSADFAFILNKQSYTMGPGGNFNTNRPAKIVGISAILLNNPSNPVEVPITMYTWDDWQLKIPVKNVPGNFPQVCYDDGQSPRRTLNFWPIPSQQPVNCRIYSWQPLGTQSTLQSILAFPPGYLQALRYNLAVMLADEFSVAPRPTTQAIAVQSLARIKTMNAPDITLRSDLLAMEPGYNYKADMFGIPY